MKERNRIGGELHDTLLQNIAGFALQLEGLSKIIKEPQSVQEDLRGLRREAEQWLRDAREFVWNLRLDSDEDESLANALSEAGKRLTEDSEIRFETEVTGVEAPVPERTRVHLLRIVEEAVHNAVRHSGATEIRLNVSYLPARAVRICIADNGRGFTPAPASVRPGHWGLITMRERAQKLGAEFSFVTEPGHGVHIGITVPGASSVNGSSDGH
jgi:signal transduction histidine kinase